MSNSPEEFEKLRKLLKIKRHEQPPPGYFSNFSGLVINRIEQQGGTDAAWIEVPWLRRLFRIFETSPLIGGLFGSAVCALVILGFLLANQVDKVPAGAYRPPGMASASQADSSSLTPQFASSPSESARSTDAMFGSSSGSNMMNSASLQPASFTTPVPH